MRDEMDGRIWVDHHADFSADLAGFLSRVAETLRVSLKRLNEMEFDAPWRRTRLDG